MKKLALIYIFLSFNLLAQDMAPQPTSNNDLREGKTIFSWDYQGEILSLNLQGENEYHLIRKSSKNNGHQKISNSKAEEIDQAFVAKFIDFKYSGNFSLEKNCGQTSKMTMRGEMFEFCLAKSKASELDSFWKELNNGFSNK